MNVGFVFAGCHETGVHRIRSEESDQLTFVVDAVNDRRSDAVRVIDRLIVAIFDPVYEAVSEASGVSHPRSPVVDS